MGNRSATVFVDYQQRASEFSVGDLAFPFASGIDESQAGTVVGVFPAIGQVDIEFAWGSGRYPVEDVQRVTGIAAKPPSSENTTVPGGVGTVSVPGGPVASRTAALAVGRVMHAYVKRALYWGSKDRNYRATRTELSGGKYACPKCKADDETGVRPHLRATNYKRSEGRSHRLLGCPSCLFLIKRQDIIGDPDFEDHSDHDHGPDEGLMAEWDGTMDQGFDLVQNAKSAASQKAKDWDDDSLTNWHHQIVMEVRDLVPAREKGAAAVKRLKVLSAEWADVTREIKKRGLTTYGPSSLKFGMAEVA